MNEIVFDYFEKMKLATMIKQEIKNRYITKKVAPYQSDVYKKKEMSSPLFGDEKVYQYTRQKISSVHGILERNLKIVEVENGFELYIPMAYGEKYVEECLKAATKRWLAEMRLKGRVSEK